MTSRDERDPVHHADDLADRHAGELAVLHAADTRHDVGDEHVLQRHREIAGAVGPVPRVGPLGPQLAGGLAGQRRDRTVCVESAASSFSTTSGVMSLSATVSQIDPVHTPCAPIASAAAICEPSRDAARREHRRRRDLLDHLRPQHDRADLAGVAAGLGALRDDDVDTDVDVLLRVTRAARERRDQDVALVRGVDDVLRAAEPSALTSSAGECWNAMSICGRAVASVQPSRWCPPFESSGSGGTPCSASTFSTQSRCSWLIIFSSWPSSVVGVTPSGSSTLAGMTRSTP